MKKNKITFAVIIAAEIAAIVGEKPLISLCAGGNDGKKATGKIPVAFFRTIFLIFFSAFCGHKQFLFLL